MADKEKSPKIILDEDWKQQARQEKEKLSQKEKDAQSAAPASEPDDSHAHSHALPPASFITLVESLVIQIMYALGKLQDPSGSDVPVNLDLAKHHIDVLQVLQDKTKNNLTDEESRVLSLRLHEVRMQYVGAAQHP